MPWKMDKQTVTEGDSGVTKMTFTVWWSGTPLYEPNATDVHLNLKLHYGTAGASDVWSVPPQITLKNQNGTLAGTFDALIKTDTVEENPTTETFEVELTTAAWSVPKKAPVLQAVGLKTTGTIIDDDAPAPVAPPLIPDGEVGFGKPGGFDAGKDGEEDHDDGLGSGESDNDPPHGESGENTANEGETEADLEPAPPLGWKPGEPMANDELGFDPVEVFMESLKSKGLPDDDVVPGGSASGAPEDDSDTPSTGKAVSGEGDHTDDPANDDAQPEGSGENAANDGMSGSDPHSSAPLGWKPGGPASNDELGFDPVGMFKESREAAGVHPSKPGGAAPNEARTAENPTNSREGPLTSKDHSASEMREIADGFVFNQETSGSGEAVTYDATADAVTGGLPARLPSRDYGVEQLEPLSDNEITPISMGDLDFIG